jgi:NADP-dependent 3-hydroxy acid dehydrogenase YdfG
VDRRPERSKTERRAKMLQPEDIAHCVLMVAKLPPRAVVPELVVTAPYVILD